MIQAKSGTKFFRKMPKIWRKRSEEYFINPEKLVYLPWNTYQ